MRCGRLPSLPLLLLPPAHRRATALRPITRRIACSTSSSSSFSSSSTAPVSTPDPPSPPLSTSPPKQRRRRRRGQQPEYDGGPINEALVASLPGGWVDVREEIRRHAESLGFAKARVTTPEPSSRFDQYKAWVAEGQHGEMGYLAREDRLARRADLDLILPGVQAVICTMTLYWPGKKGFPPASAMHAVPPPRRSSSSSTSSSSSSSSTSTKPPPTSTSSSSSSSSAHLKLKQHGVISCYSWGDDYHNLITPRLQQLAEWTHARFGGQGRWYVDTGPIMERDLAERAGMGFIGKNTLLINEHLGSGTFLAELLTTLPLPEEEPRKKSGGCGTCRRCVVACPTGAISEEGYRIDARKCVSYLTIENKGGIPVEMRPMMKNLIYGCDICQQVCPWNRWSWPENKPVRTLFTTAAAATSPSLPASSSSSSWPENKPVRTLLTTAAATAATAAATSSSLPAAAATAAATATAAASTSSSLPSTPPLPFPPLDVSTPLLTELLLALKTEEGFKLRFTGSPIQRIGRTRMLRNVAVAAGNSGEGGREEGKEGRKEAGREEGQEEGKEGGVELLRVLKEVLEGEEDEMVKEHLGWAIGRLEGEGGREGGRGVE